ncbi:hypothetical protein N431DRAFT_371745 [Stipitochalara longipes BDJ]|nr:hypothetical protein N431DRAFT_371745 [Stipitochalara longipes BDJ]
MSTAEESFEVILANFKNKLTPKERQDFQFVTLDDVRETAVRIQKDQETLKTMMNMRRLEAFVEAMKQFGEVIGIFTNASIFVAFVWGPLKFILQTAHTYADSFEHILDAYSQIGEHMPLLGQYKDIFGNRPHMRRVLALIYTDILKFHKKAVRMFRGKTDIWRHLFRSVWKDFDTRFQGLLENLRLHRQLIAEQAEILHMEESQRSNQAIIDHIQSYAKHRKEKMEKLKRKEENERDQKYRKILTWFSAAGSTGQDHDDFRAIRQESAGDGQWILQNEDVNNWREMDPPTSSILWINGIPGAGKTILASVIVDDCFKDDSYTTSYFYCRLDDPEKNDCISIYRGLLSQLLNRCREIIPYCYDKYLSSGEVNLTSTALAEQLLKLFFEQIPKHFIIVDGLDECNPAQRKLILTFFNAMVDRCDEREPGKLRVLFVSQNFSDISKALPTATVVNLTPEDNKNDIKAYIKDWSKKITRFYELTASQTEHMEETTMIRSQGMFLFVKLVMENLYAQGTRGNLIDELNLYPFPDGIGEAYERVLKRLEKNLRGRQWEIVRKLLGWMVCAKRPLKWREIQAAVSIDADEQTIDFDRGKVRGSIEDYCGSLIRVLSGDRVELVHTTAKMHIRASGYIRPSAVECHLAALCLRYLTFECFDEDVRREDLELYTTQGFLSLQDYASAKWHQHIRAIIDTHPSEFSTDAETKAALQELDTGLAEFSARYEPEVMLPLILPEARDDCEKFQSYPFWDKLLQVWNHVYQQDGKGPEARKEIGIKALSEVIMRNRGTIESLASTRHADGLTIFYGDRHFKCPRPTCFYFHEGFKDAKSRNQHINRHDRPFNCLFPDCSIAEFGFSSNKDLEKHKKLFHPEATDHANTFTAAPKVINTTQWRCELCDKRFTRGFHLRSHLRSHAGERPFKCEECGRAFTRNNDKKRHEKLHTRR